MKILKEMWGNLKADVKKPQFYGFFISLLAAAVLAMAYFYPDASMGNELRQHDMQQGAAIGHEVQQYVEATGDEAPRWTNSLFSGMPTFQISPTYPSDSLFSWITTLYGAGLPSPSNLLFMMMAGFIILMAAMKVRWYYGLIGAIAWGFSTYFIIIIGAGHIWKFVTLAYVPPTIAGIILAYRGRWLTGGALAAVAAMMQIQSNHVQMSYYFLFVALGLVIAYLVQALRKKEMHRWLKATGALAVAAILAVTANLPSLYNTYEYSKETMRGGHSELSAANDASQQAKTSGLDRDYITQYSYGRSETFSLLIPDIKGGASAMPVAGGMKPTSLTDAKGADEIMSGLNEMEQGYVTNYVSRYFGEPEGTNGPVYVGAIIFTLFILGCLIVRGPVKWALLVLTLLSMGLALGRNLMWLTDLFIDYVPMYSKFRTVESILVVAEFTIPLLAILALQKLLTTPVQDVRRLYMTKIYIAFGATALLCAAGWLFPGIYGPAITEGDQQISQMIGYQLQQSGYPREALQLFSIDNPAIAAAVTDLRHSIVSADSLRSLIFIVLAFGTLMLCFMEKLRPWAGAVLMGLLVCVDLFTVNKRYLNHESFASPEVSASDPFPLSANDRAILADTAMNYRVMNIPEFYQAAPSYHHKAIGGYHAAKLSRYQDIIDRHLDNFTRGKVSEADMNVLNMLNAKYIITPDGQLADNPGALGNAWFVDKVAYVDGPDDEMEALDTISPATEAVADRRFTATLGTLAQPHDSTATIFETTYAPHRLTYSAYTPQERVAVFSEVYFPWGWEATIDGKPTEIGRVNYILRALRIPAGEHTVEFTFRPRSVTNTVTAARIAVAAVYLLLLAALVVNLIRKESDKDTDATEDGTDTATKQ